MSKAKPFRVSEKLVAEIEAFQREFNSKNLGAGISATKALEILVWRGVAFGLDLAEAEQCQTD